MLFPGILNYLCKLSPLTAKVCKPLHELTLVKTDWAWNVMYQDLYDKAKMIIKKDICMTFYDAARPLFLENYASGVGLREITADGEWHELCA